jgi:hypothetical protein
MWMHYYIHEPLKARTLEQIARSERRRRHQMSVAETKIWLQKRCELPQQDGLEYIF